ncbi:MAG: adenosine deaminase, partial [Vagococcus sp.]
TRAITDYEAYPMREWLEAGVHFCINTDNKTVSGTSLTKEYDALRQAHQLTQEELRLLNQHAMMYSFADDRLKEELLAKI